MHSTTGTPRQQTCIDCLDGIEHERCERHGPAADTDWDQAWETSAIITELRGLDRLDQAILGL